MEGEGRGGREGGKEEQTNVGAIAACLSFQLI